MKASSSTQPWLYSAAVDGLFIIGPAFLSLGIVCLLADEFKQSSAMPEYAWVILIVLIDVAHVYSTLYRTYLDREAWHLQRSVFINVPLLSFVAAVVLYSLDSLFFWRALAYLAVFHFVRQQYGFLRLYSRRERQGAFGSRLDTIVIYVATLYPILYWHLTTPRNFNWFVAHDFLYFQSQILLTSSTIAYWMVVALYVGKEVVLAFRSRYVNMPRVGILVGTLASWYAGIVYFNGDLAFTLLNVVAHGIPYLALIWIYGQKQLPGPTARRAPRLWKQVFAYYGIPFFLGFLFLLAYLEEGFWDALVWRDHPRLFSHFYFLPQVSAHTWLTCIVPLLALPQITHYVLDGFIWRISKQETWQKSVLP